MIERHYFRNQLVKSFDFTFGCRYFTCLCPPVFCADSGRSASSFVIPNSTNTWDAVYSLPPMDDDLSTFPCRFPPGAVPF